MQQEKQKDDDRHQYIPGVQEKTSIGGAYNTGVTSDDPDEKNEIEKKGSLAVLKPKNEPSKTQNSGSSDPGRQARAAIMERQIH